MNFLKKSLLFVFLGTHRIAPRWYFKVKLLCFFSRKIKVGFGPIVSGEDDLAERKWRIDPIINAINQKTGKYVAGFFVRPEEMKKFDILIIVKKFNPSFFPILEKLKNKKLIYDIVDNPNDEPKYRFYFRKFPQLMKRIDAFILSSPSQALWMKNCKKPRLLIEHPILNPCYKTSYESSSEIRLLAQGYHENLLNIRKLEPLLPEISLKVGKPVRLYYHSEIQLQNSEFVRYIKWEAANCFETMQWADIAVTIKDLFRLHQYTKPATKVIAYMAAGLPVICKPTSADRQVIQHQVTGFFADTEEDWIRWIQRLASHTALRRRVGRAARRSVLERYSLDQIVKKYYFILDSTAAPSLQ